MIFPIVWLGGCDVSRWYMLLPSFPSRRALLARIWENDAAKFLAGRLPVALGVTSVSGTVRVNGSLRDVS